MQSARYFPPALKQPCSLPPTLALFSTQPSIMENSMGLFAPPLPMLLVFCLETRNPIYQPTRQNRKNDWPLTECQNPGFHGWVFRHQYFQVQQIPWPVPGSFARCETDICPVLSRQFYS